MSKKGFTLIELLIVITIIAILSAIGLVLYGSFIKSARDAKRQSDLKFIQSALEDYHADRLSYPATFTFGVAFLDSGREYMKEVPKDPQPSQSYSYVPSGCTDSVCTGYCLYANMEGNPPSSDTDCRDSYPAGGYDYGVTRP